MSVLISTYDGKTYEVSDTAAEAVNDAITQEKKFVTLLELKAVLAIGDIRAMESVASAHPEQPRLEKRAEMFSDDFYSAEATARRKEENRLKYQPTHESGLMRPVTPVVRSDHETVSQAQRGEISQSAVGSCLWPPS